jgi:hypothetical protein
MFVIAVDGPSFLMSVMIAAASEESAVAVISFWVEFQPF